MAKKKNGNAVSGQKVEKILDNARKRESKRNVAKELTKKEKKQISRRK